jgi:hypothetical protein
MRLRSTAVRWGEGCLGWVPLIMLFGEPSGQPFPACVWAQSDRGAVADMARQDERVCDAFRTTGGVQLLITSCTRPAHSDGNIWKLSLGAGSGCSCSTEARTPKVPSRKVYRSDQFDPLTPLLGPGPAFDVSQEIWSCRNAVHVRHVSIDDSHGRCDEGKGKQLQMQPGREAWLMGV